MLNIGIIGAGRIGKVHLESISYHVKNATVKAVADPFMNDDTRAFIESFGVHNVYNDYHKILEDKSIDAVLVCSSTDTHAAISIEAIKAGKHVFCEKPVDHSVAKIQAVADTLAANPGIKFQVGFNRRFDHNFAAIRAAYDAGKIGEAHILKITSRDPEPPNPKYIAVSGGIFLDMTIHDFDMACFLTNSDVEELYVNSAVLVDPAIGEQGDVDTAIITATTSAPSCSAPRAWSPRPTTPCPRPSCPTPTASPAKSPCSSSSSATWPRSAKRCASSSTPSRTTPKCLSASTRACRASRSALPPRRASPSTVPSSSARSADSVKQRKNACPSRTGVFLL